MAMSRLVRLERRPPTASVATAIPAHATITAYAAGWRDFLQFCEQHGAVALPATDQTVAGYLVALADGGLKAATIARRLVVISQAHKAADLPSPTTSSLARRTHAGIRRSIGTAQTARLLGGQRTKVRRGELNQILPVGLAYDPLDRVVSTRISRSSRRSGWCSRPIGARDPRAEPSGISHTRSCCFLAGYGPVLQKVSWPGDPLRTITCCAFSTTHAMPVRSAMAARRFVTSAAGTCTSSGCRAINGRS